MPRALDVAFSVCGLLALSPLFAILALIVKLHDGGPVLYRARRVGREGHVFNVMKFRTMIPDADKIGASITASGDKRITPVGKVLRRFKLDELPQLINVLKGEMSVVGARPEDPAYVVLYNDEQKQILAFRPGITSPASLYYRDEESVLHGPDWIAHYTDVVLPDKLKMDLSYLRQRGIFSDLLIILRTLVGIVR